jgi:hypothetical protein
LLYWYKSTNTDAAAALEVREQRVCWRKRRVRAARADVQRPCGNRERLKVLVSEAFSY